MENKELTAAFQQLHDARMMAYKRREAWKQIAQEVDKTLVALLGEINVPDSPVKLSVRQYSPWKGIPAIEVSFGSNPVGLSVEERGSTELFVENGASLQFTPSMAGTIALIMYPSWVYRSSDKGGAPAPVRLGTMTPDELTDPEKVKAALKTFLDAVLKSHWSTPYVK
jgi:hypothetical protein